MLVKGRTSLVITRVIEWPFSCMVGVLYSLWVCCWSRVFHILLAKVYYEIDFYTNIGTKSQENLWLSCNFWHFPFLLYHFNWAGKWGGEEKEKGKRRNKCIVVVIVNCMEMNWTPPFTSEKMYGEDPNRAWVDKVERSEEMMADLGETMSLSYVILTHLFMFY